MSLTPSISEIEPGLFIGNSRSSYDSATLRNNDIIAIVTVDISRFCQRSSEDDGPVVPIDHHMLVPALDSPTQDLLVHMSETCDFIDRMFLTVQPPQSSILSQWDSEKRIERITSAQGSGGVLVNCGQGISRSATMVIAYLMRKHGAKLDNVLATVRAKRKVKPNLNFMAQLKVWEEVGYEIWEDGEKKIPKVQYQAYLEKRAADLKAKGRTGNEPIQILSL
jgi:hypothetical protein